MLTVNSSLVAHISASGIYTASAAKTVRVEESRVEDVALLEIEPNVAIALRSNVGRFASRGRGHPIPESVASYFQQYHAGGRVTYVKPTLEQQMVLAEMTQVYVAAMAELICVIDEEIRQGRHDHLLSEEEKMVFAVAAEDICAGSCFVSLKKKHFPAQALVRRKFSSRLSRESHDGIAARNIQAQLGARFATRQAHRRFNIIPSLISSSAGLEAADLVNVAKEGLIHAAEKYDPNRGYSFLNYANFWIKQYMQNELDKVLFGKKIPYTYRAALGKIFKAGCLLHQKLQREPSLVEIATYLSLSEDFVAEALQMCSAEVRLDAPLRGKNGLESEGHRVIDSLVAEDLSVSDVSYLERMEIREEALVEVIHDTADQFKGKMSLDKYLDFVYSYFFLPREAGAEALGFSDLARKYNCTKQNVDQVVNRIMERLVPELEDRFVLPEGETVETLAYKRAVILGKAWKKKIPEKVSI